VTEDKTPSAGVLETNGIPAKTAATADVVSEDKEDESLADGKTADSMDTGGDAEKSEDDKPAAAAANDKEETTEKEEVWQTVVVFYQVDSYSFDYKFPLVQYVDEQAYFFH
jgi:hypothetical protein